MPDPRRPPALRPHWPVAVALVTGIVIGIVLFGRPRSKPPAPPTPRSPFLFTDVAPASGVRFVHTNGRTGRYRYPEIMGAGVALFDYDGDGDLDIFFVNGNRLEGSPDPQVRSVLYRNEGHGTFADVTERAGVGFVGYGQGACVGDADGDGRPDLYVTGFGLSRFYHNRGDGTFVSMEEAGLRNDGWGQSCAFLDYDGDGHLDLYVLNYLTYSLEMPQERYVTLGGRQVQDYYGPQAFPGSSSRLFHNLGNGSFEDVTKKAGLFRPDGKGMGVACVDFDGDGRTDIFQANDGMDDFLFHNLGHGRFEEIGLTAGVAVGGDGQPKGSMGVDVGDYDNDGDLDLMVPVVRLEVFSLYRNEWPFFTDVSWSTGLAEASGRVTGFSPTFADFDDDGHLDLFFATGEVQSHETVAPDADDQTRFGTPALVLRNDGKGRFVDVSRGSGPHFERALISRGTAAGDLDDDGRVDLVISNIGAPASVLRNDSAGGHWVTLTLRQKGSNGEAIGAKVWLEAAGRRQYREVHGGGAYLSTNDRRLHFGLGTATRVDRVLVRWPDGATETRTSLSVDRILAIDRQAPDP
jgi:hypothetical protein